MKRAGIKLLSLLVVSMFVLNLFVPVSAAGGTISMAKTVYNVGEKPVVSYTGTSLKDWIGIYNRGDVPGASVPSLIWEYTSKTGQPDGTMDFTSSDGGTCSNGDVTKLPAGEYDMVLCENDGYNELSRVSFTIITDLFPTSSTEKLVILQKYAPRVWLAQDEEFMPSSLGWAFNYMERYQNPNDGNRYWLRTKDALASPSDYTLPVFAGNLQSAPTYAYWVEKNNNAIDLVYFLFYPYNRGKEVFFTMFGNHVGDWEHVTVRLNKVTINGSVYVQPSQIYLPAHDFGYSYSWSDMAKIDTHPVVYSAKGSHGVWKDSGTHAYQDLGVATLSDICSQGTAWDTWNDVRGYDYNNSAGLNGVWPAWMSTDYTNAGSGDPSVPGNGPIWRWGNEHQGSSYFGQYRLEDGPTGPAAKGVWNPDAFE